MDQSNTSPDRRTRPVPPPLPGTFEAWERFLIQSGDWHYSRRRRRAPESWTEFDERCCSVEEMGY